MIREENTLLKQSSEEKTTGSNSSDALTPEQIETLRESKKRLRAILNTAADAIITINIQGIITDVNPATSHMFGYTEEELVGQNVSVLMPSSYREEYYDYYASLYHKTDKKFIVKTTELKAKRKDGSIFPIELSASEVIRHEIFTGIIRDISERKEYEFALQESEKRFRTLFQESAVCLLEEDWSLVRQYWDQLSSTGINNFDDYFCKNHQEVEKCLGLIHITEVNTASLRLFQAQSEDEILSNRKFMLGPEIGSGPEELLSAIASGQPEFSCEGYIKTVRGEYVPVIAYYSVAPGCESSLKRIIVSMIDITARKQAEEKLLKLSTAVEQSANTVVITDSQGTIEYVNPQFTKLTGYTSKEIIGQNPRILKSDTMPDEVYQDLWQTITSGNEWRGEIQNKKKNAELYWETITITPIRNKKGVITHFVAIEEDITSKKRVEELQQTLIAELDHRVKNILTTALSIAQQTLRRSRTLLEFEEAFIGRLTSLAKLHQLLTNEKWKGILLSSLVREITKPYADGQGLRIRSNGSSVMLNSKVAQAFYMLLHELTTNSIKYGSLSVPEGKLAVSWEIRNERNTRKLIFYWCESDGPAVEMPTHQGFGSQLIEKTVSYELDGEVTLDFKETGFYCRIIAPIPKDSDLIRRAP